MSFVKVCVVGEIVLRIVMAGIGVGGGWGSSGREGIGGKEGGRVGHGDWREGGRVGGGDWREGEGNWRE